MGIEYSFDIPKAETAQAVAKAESERTALVDTFSEGPISQTGSPLPTEYDGSDTDSDISLAELLFGAPFLLLALASEATRSFVVSLRRHFPG